MKMASKPDVDTMYLDNLDEFINDENKVVTYRWLSNTLQVHVNQSKQMLFDFIAKQRSEKDNDCLHVSYFLAGTTDKSKDGTKVVSCSVVPEEKLETAKNCLQHIYSCHIYSVQKAKLKDSNVLYMTDYQKMKENLVESSRYSAIKYDNAQHIQIKNIKTEDIQPESPIKASNEITNKENGDKNNNTSSKIKESKKSAKGSVIAGMFAQSNKNISKSTSADQSSKNSDSKKEPPSKKVSKKPAGMTSFFSSAAKKENGAMKSEDTGSIQPSNISNETPHEEKKSVRESDSDDDTCQKKKRRRLAPVVFESSSEEEMDSEEPLPSPSEIPDSSCKAEEMEEEPTVEKKSEEPVKQIESRIVVNKDGKRRKRIKRQKNKTFLDDEGFMVTKKVMVSDSTDISDEEMEENKETKTTSEAPLSLSVAQIKKPSSKTTDADKGPKKQSSLMSFFNKK
ncbi:DNA polymerase delta subunit 3-like [Argonauta hians]